MFCIIKYHWRTIRITSILNSLIYRNYHLKRLEVKEEDIQAKTAGQKWRTHFGGELRGMHVGDSVTLCGWVQYTRCDRFIILRDSRGLVQVLLPHTMNSLVSNESTLTKESVVRVTGQVQQRPAGQENMDMESGEVEVAADDVTVISPCKPDIPVTVGQFNQANEDLRMAYRYLDIRGSMMQHNLRLRSRVTNDMRHFLCTVNDFVDVETPTLFRRTPGGASEFLVPSRHPGQFYCLPQSPQQFKQLLMVGGMDKYMQVARCYRDETSKPDRQLEFTQLDLEMSFVRREEVMDIVEQTIVYSWPHKTAAPTPPFSRMSYTEAMTQYGTDKPDTRFDCRLKDVTHCLKDSGIKILDGVKGDKSLSSIQALHIHEGMQFVVIRIGEDLRWQSAISKHINTDCKQRLHEHLDLQSADLVILATGQSYEHHEVLGKLRTQCANIMESNGAHIRDQHAYNFLWVVDFPLFLPSRTNPGQLEATHHPFTAPMPQHAQLMLSDPGGVTGEHYDLVLNGQEIGGGSVRIHDAALQRYVLDDILQEDSRELSHLLEALDSGCPPHAGIAIGLDRYIAILCGAKSIRDVIAFPKSYNGRDPMSKAPASMPQSMLDLYHIRTSPIATT